MDGSRAAWGLESGTVPERGLTALRRARAIAAGDAEGATTGTSGGTAGVEAGTARPSSEPVWITCVLLERLLRRRCAFFVAGACLAATCCFNDSAVRNFRGHCLQAISLGSLVMLLRWRRRPQGRMGRHDGGTRAARLSMGEQIHGCAWPQDLRDSVRSARSPLQEAWLLNAVLATGNLRTGTPGPGRSRYRVSVVRAQTA